jgi:chromodomain-helicase-DNA-binding protein 4
MQVDPGVFNYKTKSVGSDGSPGSVGSAYLNSDEFDEDGSDDDSDTMADGDFAINTKSRLPQASDMTNNNPLTSHNTGQQFTIDCGLCGDRHGSGECLMVDRSENLAEYREMLILHADDEPWEERVRFFYFSKRMSLSPVSSTRTQLFVRSTKYFTIEGTLLL